MRDEDWITIRGTVQRGHRVASGTADDSPYPEGTIRLQKPLFLERGLDLSAYYEGTLNVSIHPHTFVLRNPSYTFRRVEWTPFHPPEDFSFSRCAILVDGGPYEGWVYYPHPETKRTHFHEPSILEIIAPFIPTIGYSSELAVRLNTREIAISR
jgi:hypothetical protein